MFVQNVETHWDKSFCCVPPLMQWLHLIVNSSGSINETCFQILSFLDDQPVISPMMVDCFTIIPDLILYHWENIVFIYVLHTLVLVTMMDMVLQDSWESQSFPFPKVSHHIPAWVLVFLPFSTRTSLLTCYICQGKLPFTH